MKSQLDLIVSIVSIVLSLVAFGVFFGTQRQPVAPPQAPKANLAPVALPAPNIAITNGLPGAGGGNTGGGGGMPSGGSGGGGGQRTGGPRRGSAAG